MSAIPIDLALPALREDLSLLEGPETSEGSPTWNVYDSVRNRYFRIGWVAFQLLSRWSSGTAQKIIKRVNEETTCHVTDKDIDDLLVFLYANGLTINTPTGNSQDYLDQLNSTKKHWLSWLIGNYLFFRIPLVRPHNFLKATLPFVEPFFSSKFRNLIIILGVIGLYLVAREWDVFVNSFIYFFNVQGFIAYVCTLVFIKILHELGHGYTATLYGTKISTMGVAFLVMFPVLYTDTSDSWRLKSRSQRLHIGMAGMIVELYIACIATFAWAFMPDGIYRSAAFLLATSSWIMSLSINLNALMRFDGYYILSDWWGIENLQNRAFGFGRWKLREMLFSLEEPPPENLSKSVINKLVIYAWCIWIYRLFLFIGIALLVYYFFFKLLGIMLFVIEIVWFILLPIYREVMCWWGMKEKIMSSKHAYLSLLIFSIPVILCLIPWNTKIKVPAILETTDNIVVYSPLSAQVKTVFVEEGQSVKMGDLLLRLESPLLEEEIKRTLKEIENIELQLNRQAANLQDLANVHITLSKLEELKSKHQGLLEQSHLLDIHSPIEGIVVDRDDNLDAGRWINPKLALFNIIDDQNQHIIGMLDESDIERISVAQKALFLPDNPRIKEVKAKVIEIEKANVKYLKIPYFNGHYGGEIAVRKDTDGNFVPESGVYKVTLGLTEEVSRQDFVLRGIVHIEGEAKSFFTRLSEEVTSVIIRESGF